MAASQPAVRTSPLMRESIDHPRSGSDAQRRPMTAYVLEPLVEHGLARTMSAAYPSKTTSRDGSMSLVERKLAELFSRRQEESRTSERTVGVRIPLRYVTDWSVHADSRNGAHVEIVLDGVPMNTLLVLINELKKVSSAT